MKRTLFSCFIGLAALFMLVSGAQAYQFYSDAVGDTGGCAQCHGAFRSGRYVSPADGAAWGVHLHTGHLNGTSIGSNCSNCHDGAGVSGRTVNLSTSGAAADGANAISCSGCHGRLEDAGNGGYGAGLRLHHANAGVDCSGCHNDNTPVGEDVMPAWYGSVINEVTGTTLNPCNVGGAENFAGTAQGNDNDGDLAYDGADSDCQAAEVCGDGTVDPGETCDDGTANGTTDCGCQTDCTYSSAGTSCADGEFCNGVETCDGAGTCDAGTAVVCDDGVGCTDDSCNEAGDTCTFVPNNASCDDGQFCTGVETCDPVNGCSAQGDPCAPGTICNEGTDTCDQLAQCGDGNVDAGEACDDGAANGSTTCGCQNDCTYAASSTSCADSEYCNGDETCDGAGACQAGTVVDCGDGVGCTEDICDEVAAACVNIADDTSCDDGLFCNGTESCDAVNDCQEGTDPCAAGESCNETTDTCEPTGCLVDADCDNGLFCDGNETCDTATGNCLAGTSPVTDDGVGCTADSCDEANDVVVNAPNDSLCDNGQFCDGSETCDVVNDCQAGTSPVTDDGVGCTVDSCDEVNDVVVNAPNDSLCDNGQFCDGSETCDVVNDCQAGTSPVTDDGVGCTDDSCDEVNDVVVNAPNDANCPDDGQFCTGDEFCDAINDCSSTGDPCGAGESCNETADTCNVTSCVDYSDKGTCMLDLNCEWVGKPKNGYCQEIPTPEPEICTDGVDNDLDGLADCDDPDCFGIDGCPVPESCALYTDKNSCNGDAACSWNRKAGICEEAGGGVICTDFDNQTTCEESGCNWNNNRGCR